MNITFNPYSGVFTKSELVKWEDLKYPFTVYYNSPSKNGVEATAKVVTSGEDMTMDKSQIIGVKDKENSYVLSNDNEVGIFMTSEATTEEANDYLSTLALDSRALLCEKVVDKNRFLTPPTKHRVGDWYLVLPNRAGKFKTIEYSIWPANKTAACVQWKGKLKLLTSNGFDSPAAKHYIRYARCYPYTFDRDVYIPALKLINEHSSFWTDMDGKPISEITKIMYDKGILPKLPKNKLQVLLLVISGYFNINIVDDVK